MAMYILPCVRIKKERKSWPPFLEAGIHLRSENWLNLRPPDRDFFYKIHIM